MSVLAINGSPRKGSDMYQMLGAINYVKILQEFIVY